MAIGDPYITAAQLKAYLGITDAVDDTEITSVVNSMSREVELICGRQFNKDAAATARVYEPCSPTVADVDDFYTTTGLIIAVDTAGDGTFATTLAAADYELRPLNGIVDGQSSWPYNQICTLYDQFPRSWRRAPVRVTVPWGWSAVPDPVIQAMKIAASDTFGLRTARFGVASFDQFGPIRVGTSKSAMAKLAPYVRHPVMVA